MSVRRIEELVYECDEPNCSNDTIEEVEQAGNSAPYGWVETEAGADKLLRHTCEYCATRKELSSTKRRIEKYLAKFGEVDVTISKTHIEINVDRS